MSAGCSSSSLVCGTARRTAASSVCSMSTSFQSIRCGLGFWRVLAMRSPTLASPTRRRMALLETSTAATCTKGPLRSSWMSLTRMTLRPSVSTSCLSRNVAERWSSSGLELTLGELGGRDAQQQARLLEAADGVPRRVQGLAAPAHADGGHARVGLSGVDHQVVERPGGLVLDVLDGAAEQLAQVEHRPHLLRVTSRSPDIQKPPVGEAPCAQRGGAILTRPSFSTTHRRGQGLSRFGQNLVPVVPVLPVGVSGRFRATASMCAGASPNEELRLVDASENVPPRSRQCQGERAVVYWAPPRAGAAQGAGFCAKAHRRPA